MNDSTQDKGLSRRGLLKASAGLAAATVAAHTVKAETTSVPPAGKVVTKGRIKQSIMGWTYKPMKTLELAKLCKEIGIVAMEGVSKNDYPAIKELGLEISLVGSHGFKDGPASVKNHANCEKKLRDGIDTAVEFGSKRVITFTGMREDGLSDKEMAGNCVKLWKKVIPYAEEKGILLCLEHLNSRDGSHPMKGHPGYFGDDVDFCVDLIEDVGSPNMKLLFDIYHVQIMNGDVIRRMRQYKEVIAHYHTAGNPGRKELDDTQEINYPPIMREIVASGFDGYVAQEFLPTWEDRAAALRHAVQVCDV